MRRKEPTIHVPPGTYRAVCIDYKRFKTRTSRIEGINIFLEILEPSTVNTRRSSATVQTKGDVLKHTFWFTRATASYNQRDASTILGYPVKRVKTVTRWVGKTCEIDVKDELYNHFRHSRVNFFKPWTPVTLGGGR